MNTNMLVPSKCIKVLASTHSGLEEREGQEKKHEGVCLDELDCRSEALFFNALTQKLRKEMYNVSL